MKAVMASYRQFLVMLWGDFMLVICLFAPLMMGCMFRYVIPFLEKILNESYGFSPVFTPYYVIFDLMLLAMTPLMICFAGIMVVLEELDNGTTQYLLVTPLGRNGYFLSRIGVSLVFSIVYNVILLSFFQLSWFPWYEIISCSFLSAGFSLIIAMLVISFAKNKVEGMAMMKLSGLMILGYLIAFFIKEPIGYVAGILPTFWIAKFKLEHQYAYFIPCIIISAVWFVLLAQKLKRRLCS